MPTSLMTCFWYGIISKLPPDKMFAIIGVHNMPNVRDFIIELKKKTNRGLFIGVLWQGTSLTDQMVTEFCEWITNYDISNINDGHMCSTCDPFLSLVCGLLKINIRHNFNGSMINYTHIDHEYSSAEHASDGYITFTSDLGHFW